MSPLALDVKKAIFGDNFIVYMYENSYEHFYFLFYVQLWMVFTHVNGGILEYGNVGKCGIR